MAIATNSQSYGAPSPYLGLAKGEIQKGNFSQAAKHLASVSTVEKMGYMDELVSCLDPTEAFQIITQAFQPSGAYEEAFYLKLARSDVQKGKLDQALETLRKIKGPSIEKNQLLEEIANSLIGSDRLKAYQIMRENFWNDPQTLGKFFLRVAKFDYARGDLTGAINTLKGGFYNPKETKDFIGEIFQACLDSKKREQAIELIDSLRLVNTDERSDFFCKIADSYMDDGLFEETLKFILQHSSNNNNRLLIRCARGFLNQGKRDSALTATRIIHNDLETKLSCFLDVALSYYSVGNEERVKQIIAKMIEELFQSILKVESFDCYNFERTELKKDSKKFIIKKAEIIFKKTKDHFRDGNHREILAYIKARATHRQTLKAFKATAGVKEDLRREIPLPPAFVLLNIRENPSIILGVSDAPTWPEIRDTFHHKFIQYHSLSPFPGESSAAFQGRVNQENKNFREINEAYTSLKNNMGQYAILGIKPGDNVRQAYNKLVLEVHQDKNPQFLNETEDQYKLRKKWLQQLFEDYTEAYKKLA